jgi:toxin ParE1/3/4
MARVIRTPLCRNDLKEIGRYIAEQSQSLDIAMRFLDAIDHRCTTYAESPLLGEACPDLGARVRRFSIGNYVVFFQPIEDGIELLRILHGARDIPAVWRKHLNRGELG